MSFSFRGGGAAVGVRVAAGAGHVLRWLFWVPLQLALLWALYVAVRYHHAEHRLYVWLRGEPDAPAWSARAGRGLDLAAYRMDIAGRRIAGAENLSGLAWDAQRDQLVAVLNRPATLLLLDREGAVQARHRLRGFADTEAVAALGDGWYVVSEEGRAQLALFRLPAEGNEVAHAQAVVLNLDLADGHDGNAGFEGLGYDAAGDVLYVAKEHSPTRLYEVRGLAALRDHGALRGLSIRDRSELLAPMRPSDDLSSVEFDPRSGHLLLLSDEGQRVMEVTRDGVAVSQRLLDGSRTGEPPLAQAEGAAIDGHGTLYVVSEPDRFYRLRPAGG
ncbi:uncharacterized protein YjiK [Fulvimonas soli]|uniref:Uncharacterized protein YjiK n=1 Tax=Fulvimonas soli TaxID=155197 RepID=A0A316HN07_9GAMM|nr:uncharacterized protein YjiK [Fulvimonas soli]